MRAGVEEVLDKLLMVAVVDPEPEVRVAMMGMLCSAQNHCFDSHLAQADSLRALFIGLNDETMVVCGMTLQLVSQPLWAPSGPPAGPLWTPSDPPLDPLQTQT
jgi:phosphatidylinositol kinase/protein kinase (PI-3  family)